MLKWLASKIQPELFKDMDMDQEIKDYYEKYYHVTLTDEDLQKSTPPQVQQPEYKNTSEILYAGSSFPYCFRRFP